MLKIHLNSCGKEYTIIDNVNEKEFTVKQMLGMKYLYYLSNSVPRQEVFLANLYLNCIPTEEQIELTLDCFEISEGNDITLYECTNLDMKAVIQYLVDIERINQKLCDRNLTAREVRELIISRMRISEEITLNKYQRLNTDPSLHKIKECVRASINHTLKHIAEQSPETARLIKANLYIGYYVRLTL